MSTARTLSASTPSPLPPPPPLLPVAPPPLPVCTLKVILTDAAVTVALTWKIGWYAGAGSHD